MSKKALVLVGGGSFGIWQAGAIKYLYDAGQLQYDCLYGTSVGAINGTQVHGGNAKNIVNFWLNIRTKDIISKGFLDPLLAFGRGWLHSSKPLEKYLKKNIIFDAISANTESEFWINTTDYTNKRPYSREVGSLSYDELVRLVLASASPPVYMPTVEFQGKYLCDGGVCNNFSLTQAMKDGCDDILMILCHNDQGTQEPGNLVDVLQETMGMTMNTYLEREMKCIDKVNSMIDELPGPIKPKKIKLKVIQPLTNWDFSFLDFDYRSLDRMSIINDGYETAKWTMNF